jgi:uncharacterized protein YgbK (DUF1537 family)
VPDSTAMTVPDPVRAIRELTIDRPVVVLDDDPTGTQTVSRIRILTSWSTDILAVRLASEKRGFFLLTNSRSLSAAAARKVAFDTGRQLRAAARRAGRKVSLVSRSDSTLRGHFPLEVDALAAGFGISGARIVLAPFFGDGGRVTIDDVHYVRRDGSLVPVGETEFARDPVFGFRSSDLRAWVAEKAGPRPVTSVEVGALRASGGARIAEALASLPAGGVCIVNAVEERDIDLAALGVVLAEQAGIPVVSRTAASFVRARLGQSPGRPLDLSKLRLGGPGLVVVGSHVSTTTAQLQRLLSDPPGPLEAIELALDGLLDKPAILERATRAIAGAIDVALARGATAVVHTPRRLIRGQTVTDDLRIAAAVSAALVAAVQAMTWRPGWIMAKGGITSNDIGVQGLGIREATVLGQLIAGVPVWRCAEESRWPGLVYVVFPGNVGGPGALRDACAGLLGTGPGSAG